MIDNYLQNKIEKPRNFLINYVGLRHCNPNILTLLGVVGAILAGLAIYNAYFLTGLAFIWFNRLCDGLDGAIARTQTQQPNPKGAFYDLSADFVFYAIIPLAFGLQNPINTPFAMVLLAGFILSGVSFLLYADYARKIQLPPPAIKKGIYYGFGLMEGFETMVFFSLFALFPEYFPVISSIFAFLCLLTFLGRVIFVWQHGGGQ